MARHHLLGSSRASLWFVLDSPGTGKTSFSKALLSSASNCPNIKYACGVIPGWYLVHHMDTLWQHCFFLRQRTTWPTLWLEHLSSWPSILQTSNLFKSSTIIHLWPEGPELRNLPGPPKKNIPIPCGWYDWAKVGDAANIVYVHNHIGKDATDACQGQAMHISL